MAEKSEDFKPELIKKEGDELKKAYFDANNDIKELKEQLKELKDNKTNESNKEIEKLQTQLAEFKSKQEEKEKTELEETGKYKELAEKYKIKLQLLEKNLEEKETLVKTYKEKELTELQKQEAQKQELLNKLPETERDIFQKADLDIIQKYIEKGTGKDSIVHDSQLPQAEVSKNRKMKSELLYDNGMSEHLDKLRNSGVIDF